jgi:hypothetical protein
VRDAESRIADSAQRAGSFCVATGRARHLLLIGAAALGSLALSAAPASAEKVHVLTQTFTPGLGMVGFNNPRGITVDNSSGPSAGSIYVGDTSNSRVVKFDPSGNFLWMIGRNVNEGSGNADICTNVGPPTDICKAGTFNNGPGGLGQPSSLSIDSSSGPSAGDLYVIGDSGNTNYIQKFDPSGHLVTSWGGSPFPGALDGSTAPGGPFGFGWGPLTVDPSGNLIVHQQGTLFKFAQDGSSPTSFPSPPSGFVNGMTADLAGNFYKIPGGGGGGAQIIQKVNSTGAEVGRVNSSSGTNLDVTYDIVHDDLFALTSGSGGVRVNLYHFNGSGEVVEADSTTCTPSPAVGCGATEGFGLEDLSFNAEAIAVNTSSRKVYVANSAANNVRVFSLIDVPKVTTGTVSDLARDSVTFNGQVDPDGAGDVTSCKFEYGLTTSYGSMAPCVPGTTSVPTAVSAGLPAETLSPATQYHYRLVAGNANGNRNGKDQSFTTPLAVSGVSTSAATNVGQLAATLNGSFTGDGVDTSYYFEYGPTTSYGQSTADFDHGTATGTQNVSVVIGGLYSFFTYHFRLVAHNKYGTTIGGDQSFFTLPPDLPIVESTFSSDVDQYGATVGAEIDPGSGLTIYRFEYGSTELYGSRTLVAGPIEPDSPDHTASTQLEELIPGTTYHFRVLATNLAGTTRGPDRTFTTPSAPGVEASPASMIAQTSATLNAVINPSLRTTTYHFDYGTNTAYGSSTPESGSIGPGGGSRLTSASVSGLVPNTIYHYRAVATNAIGTAFGPDQIFRTDAQPPVQGGVPVTKCKRGFVRRKGKCVRKKRAKRHKAHRRNGGGSRHG